MNLWLKCLFNSSQFVENPPVEHRNMIEILTQENSAWFATRLHFRASFVFIIYKWTPIKHPKGKISLICRQ